MTPETASDNFSVSSVHSCGPVRISLTVSSESFCHWFVCSNSDPYRGHSIVSLYPPPPFSASFTY